ncbi:MAG: methyltransferase family protein [Tepidanaerobacteraceae bacterium]
MIGIIIREIFSRDVETWENQRIVKSGIYRYIRHPAYTGNILQIVGFPLILNFIL